MRVGDHLFSNEEDVDRFIGRGVKKPRAIIIAEMFLLLIVALYFTKINMIIMEMIGEHSGLFGVLSYDMVLFFCEIFMLFVTADAMIGLSSRRPKGWKKAARGSFLLLVFTLLGSYLNLGGSVAALVTLGPELTIPLVLVVMVLLLLPSVRNYYVPPMESPRPVFAWVKFAAFSELYPSGKYRVSYTKKDDVIDIPAKRRLLRRRGE